MLYLGDLLGAIEAFHNSDLTSFIEKMADILQQIGYLKKASDAKNLKYRTPFW